MRISTLAAMAALLASVSSADDSAVADHVVSGYHFQRPAGELMELIDKMYHPTCLYPLLRRHAEARVCAGSEDDAVVHSRSQNIRIDAEASRLVTFYEHSQFPAESLDCKATVYAYPSDSIYTHVVLDIEHECNVYPLDTHHKLREILRWDDGAPSRTRGYIRLSYVELPFFSTAWRNAHQAQQLEARYDADGGPTEQTVYVWHDWQSDEWLFYVEDCDEDGTNCALTRIGA